MIPLDPELWTIGGLCALFLSAYLIYREGLPLARGWVALLLIGTLGLAGARLHSLILEVGLPLEHVFHKPSVLFTSGQRMAGGLLFLMAAVPLVATTLRVPLRAIADAIAPSVGLALAITRLGCWTRGCCFGSVADLPWAISYPRGSQPYLNHLARDVITPYALYSLPTHPLPLYLGAAGLAMTAALLWLLPRRRYAGEVAIAFVAVLGLSVGGLETFREAQLVSSVPMRQAFPLIAGVAASFVFVGLRLRMDDVSEDQGKCGAVARA